MVTMRVDPSLFTQLLRASIFMKTERRYSIILEHSAEVLLNNALMAQVEAFWDANDARYFGLRIEDEHSAHARVMVTDKIPDDDGE